MEIDTVGSPKSSLAAESFNLNSARRDHHSPDSVSYGISSVERAGQNSPPQTPHPTKPKEKTSCCWVFLKCLFPCFFSSSQTPSILITMQTLLTAGKFAEILQSLSSKAIHHGQPNNINIKNADNETILFLLCWHERDATPLKLNGIEFTPTTALIQLVIEHGAALEVRNRYGRGFMPNVSAGTRYLIVNSATVETIESNKNLTLSDAVERAILVSQSSWIGVGHSAVNTWVDDKGPIRKKYLEKALAKIPNWDPETAVEFPTPKGIFKVAIEYSYFEEWRALLRAMVTHKNSTPRSFQRILNEEFEFILNKIHDLSQPSNEHLSDQLDGYKRTAELLAQGNTPPVYPDKLAVGANGYEQATEDFFKEIRWDPRKPEKGVIVRLHTYT